MRHTFEEEFRLENPQWDFDNDILGPYTRWLDAKLLEARKQLALYNAVEQSEQLCPKCGSDNLELNDNSENLCNYCGNVWV